MINLYPERGRSCCNSSVNQSYGCTCKRKYITVEKHCYYIDFSNVRYLIYCKKLTNIFVNILYVNEFCR
jgi:hypothetical protein